MKNSLKSFLIFTLICLLTLTGIGVIAFPNYPSPTSYKYINDYTNILKEEDKLKIASIGKELETKTTCEATVAIINTLDGQDIESYTNKLFRTWGIGQKNKDNGLLILIAIKDKKWRVEVGRGLEGAIPDVLTSRVMETLAKPEFTKNNYAKGVIDSYSALCNSIASEYNITLDNSSQITIPKQSNNSTNNSKSMLVPAIALVILVLLDLTLNRGRITKLILNLIFLSSNHRGGGFGGFGGGSSSSGGGFGGGSSNGGGSSGSW